MTKPSDTDTAKKILTTFAQYGFRKTSMTDIARAAGVSRQSIYKKFGSKDRCYEWTQNTYLSGMYTRIFAAMSKESKDSFATLLHIFDILIGEAVKIISNPHGAEVLNDVLSTTHASDEDWPLRFRARLADFLERYDYATPENSTGVAYGLISAGKGLLLEEATREHFLDDMQLILKSLLVSKE